MTYTDEDIRKYRALCLEYFNEEVSDEMAAEELNSLMFLMNLIYHPQLKEYIEKSETVSLDSEGKKGDDQ